MVILDTDLISEPMKRGPSEQVASWLDRQEHGTLCVTSVNVAELFLGIEILPDGKRKRVMRNSLTKWLYYHVGSRILPFDNDAAREFVLLSVEARKKGFIVSFPDAQIASIAKYHGYAIATRDEAPFKAMGANVINPWQDGIESRNQ